jgi:hypothetical protein
MHRPDYVHAPSVPEHVRFCMMLIMSLLESLLSSRVFIALLPLLGFMTVMLVVALACCQGCTACIAVLKQNKDLDCR